MEVFKKKFKKIKEEGKEIKKEIRERTLGYITVALGLVAALAWNEAIKASIEHFFPLSRNTLLAKFIYAVLMTLVVVIMSVYLARLFKRESK